jgi:predicted ATP-dependent protease
MSSLAGLPIKQAIGVTGAVNQHGDILPIGGVNEKIEGFFAICEARGLTGEQGVIIPQTNVRDLMLPEKIVEAVREGKFKVWAVTKVEETLELLMGKKAGKRNKKGEFAEKTIHAAVEKRLRELSKGHSHRDDDDEKKKPARKRKRVAPKKKVVKKVGKKRKVKRVVKNKK